jgi:hypothetical protein
MLPRDRVRVIPDGTGARRQARSARPSPRACASGVGAQEVFVRRNDGDVPQAFGALRLGPRQTYRVPFPAAATFDFACSVHQNGQATAVVERAFASGAPGQGFPSPGPAIAPRGAERVDLQEAPRGATGVPGTAGGADCRSWRWRRIVSAPADMACRTAGTATAWRGVRETRRSCEGVVPRSRAAPGTTVHRNLCTGARGCPVCCAAVRSFWTRAAARGNRASSRAIPWLAAP